MTKPFRLLAFFLLLTFSSEQILFAFPGEGGLLFSSPTRGYGSVLLGEEKGFHSLQFFSPKTPYRAIFEGLPKTSSLKLAGWFKKLFRKIARFFQRVVEAVTKVIQKITSVVTKALSAVFGKSIGSFLGKLAGSLISLIAQPVLLLAHTAAYAFQGDFKGLLKYWGQAALQAAMTAMMFIPGVGQALYGALQFILQPLLAVGKFLIGGLLQGLGAVFSGVGSFLGGFSQAVGGFFKGIGSFLKEAGRSLVNQAKQIFSNLKEQGFKGIFENLKRSLGLSKAPPLPPHAGIEIGRPLPDGVSLPKGNSFAEYSRYFQAVPKQGRSANPLQTQIEKVATDFLVALITGGKVDKQGEKGKITKALESVIGTAVHAGVDALKDRFLNQLSPASSLSPIESAGVRAPPVYDSTIRQEGNGPRYILNPNTRQPSFSQLPNARGYAFAHNGSGQPYELTRQGERGSFSLQKLQNQNTSRADLFEGRQTYAQIDPRTGNITSVEEVGNLALKGPIAIGEKSTEIPSNLRYPITAGSFGIDAVPSMRELGSLIQDFFSRGPAGVGDRIGRALEDKFQITKIIPSYEFARSSQPDGTLNFRFLGVENAINYDLFHYATEFKTDPLTAFVKGEGRFSIFNAAYKPEYPGLELPTFELDFQKAKVGGAFDNGLSVGGGFFVGFLDLKVNLPDFRLGDLEIKLKPSVSLLAYARDFRRGLNKVKFEFANGLGGGGLEIGIRRRSRRNQMYGLN